MSDTETLRKVVEERHHVRCTYIRQETVYEDDWSGTVAVFSCADNPSMLVYACADKQRCVTVVGKPPIWSARDAVRAHFAVEADGAHTSLPWSR